MRTYIHIDIYTYSQRLSYLWWGYMKKEKKMTVEYFD